MTIYALTPRKDMSVNRNVRIALEKRWWSYHGLMLQMLRGRAMDLFWSFFEKVSGFLGQDGAVVLVAIVLGLGCYLVLGAPGPGR